MSRRPLRVTLLVDWAEVPDHDPEYRDESPPPATEYHVANALRELGHTVSVVSAGNSATKLIQDLEASQPELVFNLTEQFRLDRRLDACVAGLLELIGVPFTGSGSAGLMLARDKGLSKQLLGYHRIRVPGFTVCPPGKNVRIPKSLKYPLVIKPAFTDGSEGISNASLATHPEAVRDRVLFIHEKWKQAAIVEEYIQGRELYVGILGNERLTILPPRELYFEDQNGSGPVLATYRVKWDEEYQKKWGIRFDHARLDPETAARIARTCKKVYRAMQVRDYGRIDLRLAPDGRVVIIEVNPNPDIAYGEEVAEAAARLGLGYNQLVDRIIASALRRRC